MKTKGIAETILIFTAIVVCTTDGGAHCAKQTSQAAPGTSTGTAIGTAIKTAIGVAFPAISQVISAIWPNNSSGNKNKTQAADAIKTMQDQSVAALKQISSITTDLDTITLFLSNSVVA